MTFEMSIKFIRFRIFFIKVFHKRDIPQNIGSINDLQMNFEGQGEQVWKFRFVEYNNDPNYPARPIPVELRGRSFDGFLTNGDMVKIIKAKWSKGGTLEAEEIWNETTSSHVKRKRF